MVKLFAVGFPREMGEEQLRVLFDEFGDVASLTLVTDQETGKSKGYAFIHYSDDAGARLAIKEMNGSILADRTIYVRYADDAPPVLKKDAAETRIDQSIAEEKTIPRPKRPRMKR
jgi:RNA recognition motif-containing protein